MSEVPQGSRKGQTSDPARARELLEEFVALACELAREWDPVLDVRSYPRALGCFEEVLGDLVGWRDEVRGEPADDDESLEPLNLADLAKVRVWLDRVETHVKDALAAGEDATRPPARRDLGRRTARSALLEARQSLQRLLHVAKRGVG